jgi:hypothetical protein
MTVLEELIDISLRACEKGRHAGQKRHHARGCALLTSGGKVSPLASLSLSQRWSHVMLCYSMMYMQVYSGCDVYAVTSSLDTGGGTRTDVTVLPDVSAEKSAILAAISDGSKDFEVSIHTMPEIS